MMDFISSNIPLLLLVVVSGSLLVWSFLQPSPASLNNAQATQLINREDAIVIDVRELAEFVKGHLPDARNIPLSKLADKVADLGKDKPLLVCCASGVRSRKASEDLRKLGFDKVYNLEGGVDAWVGAGMPIKKGSK
ncbi:MAG: hypothetical protein RIR00_337 [Pseudomonadota bacterium]